MKDYRTYSYWLETCGDELTPRPPLDGSIDVDVAILGAGYTGLWTAYYLLSLDPSLKIAILEKEIAGFGASGRNGAWCTSGFPTGVGTLADRYGLDTALAVQRVMFDAVDEIGRVSESAGIDIEWRKGGSLRIARGQHQLPQIQKSYETYQKLGLGDEYQYLDKSETDARVSVTDSRSTPASWFVGWPGLSSKWDRRSTSKPRSPTSRPAPTQHCTPPAATPGRRQSSWPASRICHN
jgi:2-polyprenyl-6-methoxyphenol hydroxylase-like FAD-dependent oxidoreductase